MKLLPDGTAVDLYEVYGDPQDLEAVYEGVTDSLYRETATYDGVTFVYEEFEPSPLVHGLLETVRNSPLIIERPIRVVDGNQLQVGLVADTETIQSTLSAVPESAQVTVEETARFRFTRDRLYTGLTDRQQEILRLAIEMGYYDIPRNATYEDIAEVADCTPTTVGDHLRKVEQSVLRAITPTAAE